MTQKHEFGNQTAYKSLQEEQHPSSFQQTEESAAMALVDSSSNHGSTSTTQTMSTSPLDRPIEKHRSLSPSSSSDEVRLIGLSECEGAAKCLSEAFAIDDVARYFLDTDDMAKCSEKLKWKLHCDIIHYITAAHCLNGIVTTIGSDYDAVALW